MRIRYPKDFWAGLMFIAFGSGAIAIGANYPLGTAARMGPGYFPRILGVLLVALGLLMSIRALFLEGEGIPKSMWKPLILVLGSVALFGMLLPRSGLVVATLALILTASCASHEFTWRASMLSGALLAALSVMVFHYGLGLPFTLWPSFIKG
jgi:Tripartite tricarboxylate transporter TctB family